MIKRFNGYEPAQNNSFSIQNIVAGNYVGKIYSAIVLSRDTGEQLCLELDITEGEYEGYYHKLQKANEKSQYEDKKKYKGTYRIWIPNDDGSENDTRTKRRFNGTIWAIENSNNGYRFDFNEKSLVGKSVGIMICDKEWEMEGKRGITQIIGSLCSVDEARDENTPTLRPRMLNGTSPNYSTTVTQSNSIPGFPQNMNSYGQGGFTPVSMSDELPF